MDFDIVEYVSGELQVLLGFRHTLGSAMNARLQGREVIHSEVPPRLKAMLSFDGFDARALQLLMRSLTCGDLPSNRDLVRGRQEALQALSSAMYSLEIFLRYFEKATNSQVREATASLLQPNWNDVMAWCNFLSSQIATTLPNGDAKSLLSIVAAFVQRCIRVHGCLVDLPQTIDFSVQCWVATDVAGKPYILQDPNHLQRLSVCPILQIVSECLQNPHSRPLFIENTEHHPRQRLVAKHAVDRVKALISLLQCPPADLNILMVCNWMSSVVTAGAFLVDGGVGISDLMTRFRFFKHIFIAMNRILAFALWKLAIQPHNRYLKSVPRWVLNQGRDIVRSVMGSRRRLLHLVEAVSAGALTVLLSAFDPTSPIDPESDLAKLGVNLACEVILHAAYTPVRRAIHSSIQGLPQRYLEEMAFHSQKGEQFLDFWRHLQSQSETRPVNICDSLKCTGSDNPRAKSYFCARCRGSVYCCAQCQTEDWGSFHKEQCHAGTASYLELGRQSYHRLAWRYARYLAAYIEALCVEKFVETAMDNSMPTGILLIKMQELPPRFEMLSYEECRRDYLNPQGAAFLETGGLPRMLSYLNREENELASIKLAYGFFLWGSIKVAALARLRYEEDPIVGANNVKFTLANIELTYYTHDASHTLEFS